MSINLDIRVKKANKVYHEGEKITGIILIQSPSDVKHDGITLAMEGTVNLQLSARNVGIFDAFYNSVKPIQLVSCVLEVAPPGKIPSGKTEIPFEFPLVPKGNKTLYETYHGVFVNIQYLLRCEIKRNFLAKDLIKVAEFIVEYKSSSCEKAVPHPVNFSITPESLQNIKDKSKIPRFKVTGKLDSTMCCVTKPFTGWLIVEHCDVPIKSIELQLVRVETCGCAEGYARDATEIQNIQIGEGNVCWGLALPIYMIFPRLFTCPTLSTSNFKVGELAGAIRSKTNLVFGVYHSLFEWFHPLYLKDKKSKFEGKEFVLGKTIPELVELVEKYKPEVIWSDGDWEAPDTYWNSKEFLAWLYNDSPVKNSVVVNDRWGSGIPCKHGGYFTCSDRFNPGVLQSHKWENCMTIDKKSWGYRRNAQLKDYLTTHDLIKELVETVSCGGNLLMNIGPTKDGLIPIIFQERLYDVGKWLKVNGEAIYSSQPWTTQNDTYTPEVWYTRSGGNLVQVTVYAVFLRWPIDGYLTLEAPKFTTNTTVNMLGYSKPLKWKLGDTTVTITLPDKAKTATDWAWVLKIMDLLS